MRIRRLTLKDYGGFEDATIDLDRPLTVLFGVNGSGKSTVLTACASVLSSVLRERWRMPGRAHVGVLWGQIPTDTDIRRGADSFTLRADLKNGDRTETVVLNYPEPVNYSIGIRTDLVRLHDAAPHLSVYYGAVRDVVRAKDAFAAPESEASEAAVDASSATADAMAVGALKFRTFFQWFKAREDVENEWKVAKQDLSLEDPHLGAVRRAVASMLPGFSGLRIQRDPLHMVVSKDDHVLAIDQLSDGEKVSLTMAADLARRLAMTYPTLADPLQGEAVVLIDEMELHMHPNWQRRVLGYLRTTFPQCQFVVSTHSPQVLSEVPNESVVLVSDFQFFRPPAPTEGRDSNAILWEVLGVPVRSDRFAGELEELSRQLDDGKLEEVRAGLDRLAQALTERDPEVSRLRGLLDLVERMDADDQEGT